MTPRYLLAGLLVFLAACRPDITEPESLQLAATGSPGRQCLSESSDLAARLRRAGLGGQLATGEMRALCFSPEGGSWKLQWEAAPADSLVPQAAVICCDGKTVFDAAGYPNVDRTGRAKSTGLQAALDDVARRSTCTSSNICTLYFRQGTYLSGQILLRSDVKLFLESGAKLRASTDRSDYTLDPGTHRTAFIKAENVSYTGISGTGTIDGDGLAYRRRNNASSPYPYWNCRTTTNAMCWDSPRLVLIRRSHHVTVEDVMMLDPAAWTNHIHYSNQVTYRNVKVVDDRTKFNTDAVDVDASTNVTVSRSYYHGRDDGFCVKATGELGLIQTSRNIRFLDNTVAYGNNATKLGTETYVGGNMDGITIRNLRVTNAATGVRHLSARRQYGGRNGGHRGGWRPRRDGAAAGIRHRDRQAEELERGRPSQPGDAGELQSAGECRHVDHPRARRVPPGARCVDQRLSDRWGTEDDPERGQDREERAHRECHHPVATPLLEALEELHQVRLLPRAERETEAPDIVLDHVRQRPRAAVVEVRSGELRRVPEPA